MHPVIDHSYQIAFFFVSEGPLNDSKFVVIYPLLYITKFAQTESNFIQHNFLETINSQIMSRIAVSSLCDIFE